MPNYKYVCRECKSQSFHIFKYESRPEILMCPNCEEGVAEYTIDAPAVLQEIVTSVQPRGKHYSEIKEYARLKRIEASLPHGKRGDVKREISKITGEK